MKTSQGTIGSLRKLGAAAGYLLCGVLSLKAQNPVTLQLERSTNQIQWESVEITGGMLDSEGRIVIQGAPGQEFYRLRIDRQPVPPGTEGFAQIPAGSFAMGDPFSENVVDERPVHSVSVSAFLIEEKEVSKALWDEVAAWAAVNGYDINAASASGKAPDHPAYNVNWYECVKWCNARSEKDGLTPCYTVGGAIYRTGSSAPVCDFAATGYRLPTEAEWEKAARGGLSGQRFPWGNTISHVHANYYANSFLYSYDVNPTLGHHPTYDDGGTTFTAPVGSFAPNGYGLYDVAGNVWEWCWDWFGGNYYASSPGSDPRGPATGSQRVCRGGSWNHQSDSCRTALRNPYYPDSNVIPMGFRSARSSAP